MQLPSLSVRRRALLALAGAVLVSAAGFAPSAEAQDIRSQQWYLDAMKADAIWKVSRGQGIKVAVIDTGVNTSLPELKGQVLGGKDVSDGKKSPERDSNGHGSNMAALIAGTGSGGGIQGLAPESKILPVKIAVDGEGFSVDSALSRAIRFAVGQKAQVINISLSSTGASDHYPKTRSAIEYALGRGSLVLAGAGNDGEKGNLPSYPAAIPGVVGVGAIDRNGNVAKWSTSGDHVGLVALGDGIPIHCTKTEGICNSGGTSQATAIASASAALIWAKHPKWTNNQVLRVMMQTAAKPTTGKLPSIYVGYGSIRPRKVLLDGEGDPGPADVNPLLAREGATKPDPSASASASKSPSADPQSTPTPQHDKKSDKKTVAEPKKNDDNSSTLWIAIGAGAVLLGAAVAFALVRRRGRA
ncbi:S8 family serine peptidase [Streptomyces sparsogenes]|uniref:Peptidase S8 and S53 subtilisin kexin sedolisin n=1 Tax=Streptomyces sparsogenes DSM 40356 TaxID=1331668 RepID=A0A1R1SQV4_9ACTN|nr:S8 family serine peptidase [Streptomyces sparsogenes]OMI40674.1 peptidase S8 and S53 subtilisin kexin sedolisin [Streptomyces sparsogenes DSM 40356]